jgi:hypothetical protein
MSPQDCVIPLYGVDEDNSPEAVGSGVLLEIGPMTFLATATHVFTDNPNTTFYYPGKNGLEELTGTPLGGDRDEEDVSVMLLDDSMANNLAWDYAALPVYFVEMNDVTQEGDHYSLLGFPEESTRVDCSAAKVRAERLLYTGKASDKRTYRKCGVQDISHIVINHSKKKARNADGKKVKAPLLNCMSGGAVWMMRKVDKAIPGIPSVALVGITIEKHDQHAAVVATRINFAMEIIRSEHPELSGLIPTSSTICINVTKKAEEQVF